MKPLMTRIRRISLSLLAAAAVINITSYFIWVESFQWHFFLFLVVMPLIVVTLSIKFPVAGGSPAFGIGLFGLFIFVFGGSEYIPAFRYLMITMFLLLTLGGFGILWYAARGGN